MVDISKLPEIEEYYEFISVCRTKDVSGFKNFKDSEFENLNFVWKNKYLQNRK